MPPRWSSSAGLPPEIAAIPQPRSLLGRVLLNHAATTRLRFPAGQLIIAVLVAIVGSTLAGMLAGDVGALNAFRGAPRCAGAVVDAGCLDYTRVAMYEAAPGDRPGYFLTLDVRSGEQVVLVDGGSAFEHAVQAGDDVQAEIWRGDPVTVTVDGITEKTDRYPVGVSAWDVVWLAVCEVAAWQLLRSAAKVRLGRKIGVPVVWGIGKLVSRATTLATGALALAGTVVLCLGNAPVGWTIIWFAFAVMWYAVAVPMLIPRALRYAIGTATPALQR